MRPLYIFDLDDTLALTAHRQHLLSDRNDPECWRRFFAACAGDAPNLPVIRTMQALRRGGADIWIWTGRSVMVRDLTLRWLSWNAEILLEPYELRMRPLDDHRPDVDLKREWLGGSIEEHCRINLVAAFDDRPHIAEMWRAAGVQCFLVGQQSPCETS